MHFDNDKREIDSWWVIVLENKMIILNKDKVEIKNIINSNLKEMNMLTNKLTLTKTTHSPFSICLYLIYQAIF